MNDEKRPDQMPHFILHTSYFILFPHVHLVVLGFRQPFLGRRFHHALELLDTSLGTELLLGKRLQIRRREQG